jgi:hypothetical protein
MWSSAFEHFGEILAPEQPQAPVPVQQPHFNASACIQLLGVLPQSEGALRESALARLRTFMAEDEGTVVPPPTVPRASSSRRRRPRSVTASESGSSESSESSRSSSDSSSSLE